MLTNPPRMEISEELLYIDKRLVLAVRFHRSIQGNFFNHLESAVSFLTAYDVDRCLYWKGVPCWSRLYPRKEITLK